MLRHSTAVRTASAYTKPASIDLRAGLERVAPVVPCTGPVHRGGDSGASSARDEATRRQDADAVRAAIARREGREKTAPRAILRAMERFWREACPLVWSPSDASAPR